MPPHTDAKPDLLCFNQYDDWDTEPMLAQYTVHQMPASMSVSGLPADLLGQVRAFAFKGHDALSRELMDAFPNLGIIANYGVGYDTIDVAYASSRGIAVTNTPDVLTDDVADLAVGMLLALNRDIPGASDWVHSGRWVTSGAYPLQRTLSGATVGIAGLGRIGRAVAQRLQGFNTDIHYYSRADKSVAGLTWHASLTDLARAVDILMVTVSGGPDTQGIISAKVIQALGSDGVIVNSARGSTMDEEALILALQKRELRGAALDVFNQEPDIDPRFLQLENVLLQPHQSSGTVETRKRMGELQRDNLNAFFAGKPLLTQVN